MINLLPQSRKSLRHQLKPKAVNFKEKLQHRRHCLEGVLCSKKTRKEVFLNLKTNHVGLVHLKVVKKVLLRIKLNLVQMLMN